MDYKRLFVIAGLLFTALLLWQAWEKDYAQVKQPAATASTATTVSSSEQGSGTSVSVSAATSTAMASHKTPSLSKAPLDRLVRVKTDLFNVAIDTKGGKIVNVDLRKLPQSLNSKKAFTLLNDNPESFYIAQDGITDAAGMVDPNAQFHADKTNYTLASGQDVLPVKLTWRNKDGVIVEKTYQFERNHYRIKTQYKITNQGNKTWRGHIFQQITRKDVKLEKGGMFYIHSYQGAAISSPEKRYQKIPFSDMKDTQLNKSISDGWLAVQQHYFLSAWVPTANMAYDYYTHVVNDDTYTIGMRSLLIELSSGAEKTIDSQFYAGPEDTTRLKAIAPGLQLTVDYGILWPISIVIFWLMSAIHSIVGNWGWSIVLVTIAIKVVLYWPSSVSYRSMAKLRRLQPKMEMIRERYGDDRQKVGQAMMELYKKEKVNPLGGCLPILLQIPIFIALYWVLLESVELRQAPFIFWIHDLSAKDPFYVLPIIMGASMFLQQRLSPTPPDPIQAKMMMFLPVVFTFLFIGFPSGLVLYWVVNNLVSISQQWYITQKHNDSPPKKAKSKKSKPTSIKR